jgi:hypothetical protein
VDSQRRSAYRQSQAPLASQAVANEHGLTAAGLASCSSVPRASFASQRRTSLVQHFLALIIKKPTTYLPEAAFLLVQHRNIPRFSHRNLLAFLLVPPAFLFIRERRLVLDDYLFEVAAFQKAHTHTNIRLSAQTNCFCRSPTTPGKIHHFSLSVSSSHDTIMASTEGPQTAPAVSAAPQGEQTSGRARRSRPQRGRGRGRGGRGGGGGGGGAGTENAATEASHATPTTSTSAPATTTDAGTRPEGAPTPSNSSSRGRGRGRGGNRGRGGSRGGRGADAGVRGGAVAGTRRMFGGHLTSQTQTDEPSGTAGPGGLRADTPDFVPGQPIKQHPR